MYTEYSFHETEVLDFLIQNNDICLRLEGVTSLDNKKINGEMKFQEVKIVLIDGKPSRDIKMFYSDGEVISLEKRNDGVMLIIEWHRYNPHVSKTLSYLINAENVDWSVYD